MQVPNGLFDHIHVMCDRTFCDLHLQQASIDAEPIEQVAKHSRHIDRLDIRHRHVDGHRHQIASLPIPTRQHFTHGTPDEQIEPRDH